MFTSLASPGTRASAASSRRRRRRGARGLGLPDPRHQHRRPPRLPPRARRPVRLARSSCLFVVDLRASAPGARPRPGSVNRGQHGDTPRRGCTGRAQRARTGHVADARADTSTTDPELPTTLAARAEGADARRRRWPPTRRSRTELSDKLNGWRIVSTSNASSGDTAGHGDHLRSSPDGVGTPLKADGFELGGHVRQGRQSRTPHRRSPSSAASRHRAEKLGMWLTGNTRPTTSSRCSRSISPCSRPRCRASRRRCPRSTRRKPVVT